MITDALVIIPARYASSRFPGKPLALLDEEPVVWHTYCHAVQAVGADNVFVATDDERIAGAIISRGGHVVITEADIPSGTARCAAALQSIDRAPQIVVNLQADEPFITPADIIKLIECFSDPEVEIASLARRFDPDEGFDALFSPDNVKVVMDSRRNALYFSRSIIPYVRDRNWQQWTSATTFHIHIGLYAFRPATLMAISDLPPSAAERAESLEQLRWLADGRRIRMTLTPTRSLGIDTPADLEAARKILSNL